MPQHMNIARAYLRVSTGEQELARQEAIRQRPMVFMWLGFMGFEVQRNENVR